MKQLFYVFVVCGLIALIFVIVPTISTTKQYSDPNVIPIHTAKLKYLSEKKIKYYDTFDKALDDMNKNPGANYDEFVVQGHGIIKLEEL